MLKNIFIPSKGLSLESFVVVLDGTKRTRFAYDLTLEDSGLVYFTYLSPEEFTAYMTDEQQLFFALFILESEGR